MPIIGAFMVPHPPLIMNEVGHGREKAILNTIEAYKKVAKQIASLKPETIVLVSPHSLMYADYFHISPGKTGSGDFGEFGAEEVRMKVTYDEDFTKELFRILDENDFPGGRLGDRKKSLDHGTMVPLYFINKEYKEYKLVRIGISGQSYQAHYTLGEYIKKVTEELEKKVVFIASGDLSHRLTEDGPYGFQQEGPEYDARIMDIMGNGNFSELFNFEDTFCENAAECGHRSFLIMAGALDRTSVNAKKLSYEGPFGVGYGICSFEINGIDEKRNFGDKYMEEYQREMDARKAAEDEYVRLARHSLETYVISQKVIEVPNELPEEMITKRAGTFVSIKMNGQLRGCIGTTAPTRKHIAEEIIYNAISAGTKDPRFPPICMEELDDLVYNVDVLGETELIATKEELDVKRYGVIVSKGSKRGLLLPNLEGVDTVEDQISISKRKAGIDDEEEVILERFEVVRHT